MRVAVLGAGAAGLTAAHRLAKLGHETDVYERWPGLGGQAATIDVGGGVLLERYYHVLFTSDVDMAELCEEIDCELETWKSSVAIFRNGELHPFTTALDLLRFKPMSLPSRIRVGFGALWLQRRAHSVEPYEGITIRAWVERVMGKQAWEHIWGPLLYGKFRDQADRISMSWLWAKLRNRRQVTGEEAKGELLVYPKGSFESIFIRLRDLIEQHGGRVFIDRPAARVARDEGGGFVVTPGAPNSFRRGHDPRGFEPSGVPERYDAVIAALPSDVFERAARPRPRRRDRRRVPGQDALDRVLRGALPADRARPEVPSLLLDQRRRHGARVHRPDRAGEPGPDRALRRSPLPLRRQLPATRS